MLNLVKLMSNKPKSKLVELMFCWKFLLMFQEIICSNFQLLFERIGLDGGRMKIEMMNLMAKQSAHCRKGKDCNEN